MFEPLSSRWFNVIVPICLICFFYLCSYNLYICATNSLIYSTVCLLHGNQSFCSEIDQNKSLGESQEIIQKESSKWSLYGTLSFSIIACLISPFYGSLSDKKNRQFPIILTISNGIITGLIITIGSIFRGTKICLLLYILANIVNGFGGGSLILISSCFCYAIDVCINKEQYIQTIAIIEASLNIGVMIGYILCSFVFELHSRIWHILIVHVILLSIALFISHSYLRNEYKTRDILTNSLWRKMKHPFNDIKDLFFDLKSKSLLKSFILLLLSIGFYELFRMGSSSVFYLYLHRMSFNDIKYSVYFTCEQLGTCIALVFLALLRQKWKINEIYLSIIGLCLSLIGLILLIFANNNQMMIFGAIPSMMFGIYFPVCLRVIITRLVPEKDKGKALSLVAFIQNVDVIIGTIACIEIYRISLGFFVGLVFIFAIVTRLIALIFILIQSCCISNISDLSVVVQDDEEQLIRSE